MAGIRWKPSVAGDAQRLASAKLRIIDAFTRRQRPSVVDFLQDNIVLPAEFAPAGGQGPFRIGSRRYQIPILEAWNPDNGARSVTNSMATQMGKSSILALGMSYRMVHAPLPAIITAHSSDWLKNEISLARLQPLINGNKILSALKPVDSDLFAAMDMHMQGMRIHLGGGNSPGALAGGTFGIVVIDEAAKIQHRGSEQAPEAHPINLALKRSDEFGDQAFDYLSSTPNVSSHPFWIRIEEGTMTYFFVACPHCREWFPFDFIGTDDDRAMHGRLINKSLPTDYRSVVWDTSARDASGKWNMSTVAETTRYICPHNGCEITEAQRLPMVEALEWRATNENADKRRLSFIGPSFFAPKFTFGRMATEFITSQIESLFGLQDFYNSRLARPWEKVKRQVKDANILSLKGTYARRTIPTKPRWLILTADPGETRTHWMITAIGMDGTLHVIDWGTVLSIEDLGRPDFIRARSYPIAGTDDFVQPVRGFCDSGYMANRVYDMCGRSRSFWWPTYGANTRTGTYTLSKITSHPGLERIAYVDHTAKMELYIQRIAALGSPGVTIPADAEIIELADDKGLIAGLTGQKLMEVGDLGEFKKIPWDHYGDTLKIALIASWVFDQLADVGERVG